MTAPKQLEDFLDVDEVAAWFKISPRTVRSWVHLDYIPYMKLGAMVRFSPSTLLEWAKKRETSGRATYRPSVGLDKPARRTRKTGP